jgi:hypothetical protein
MSLISFGTFREMAAPSITALRRGTKSIPPEINYGDRPRRPHMPDDRLDREFLSQFELKEYTGAWTERLKYFMTEINPKLQSILEDEINKLGVRESLAMYLSTGRESKGLAPIPPKVKEYVKENYGEIEGQGINVPVPSTDDVEGLRKKIYDALSDLKHKSSSDTMPLGLSPEDVQNIHSVLGELDKKEYDRTAVVKKLQEIYKKLYRIVFLEEHAHSILYEIVKENVDSREFWKKNGLDPETITVPIPVSGSKGEGRAGDKARRTFKPYFFELYHKLEREPGKEHIPELKGKIGPGLGYDLKSPKSDLEDDGTPRFTTHGSNFALRYNVTDDYFVRWIQDNSYGLHGPISRELSSPDSDVVFMSSTRSSSGKKLFEDPLYDWLFDDLVSKIKINLKKEKTDSGEQIRQSDCYKKDKKGNSVMLSPDACAKRIAEKILKKFIKQGGLVAPAFPCEGNKKHGIPCPTVEDRTYKVDSKGKIITPPLYIPHEVVVDPKTNRKKFVPLLRPHLPLKPIDPQKFAKDYEASIERISSNFEDGTFKHSLELQGLDDTDATDDDDKDHDIVKSMLDDDGKLRLNIPATRPFDIEGSDAGNRGGDTSIPGMRLGQVYNLAGARSSIFPETPRGREVVTKYLQRAGTGAYSNMVPAFAHGINACTGSGKCGGANKNLKMCLRAASPVVHEIIYRSALASLADIKARGAADELLSQESGKVEDRNMAGFAFNIVSTIAQHPEKYYIDLDDAKEVLQRRGITIKDNFKGYTRRIGYKGNVADVEDGPGGDIDSDVGYVSSGEDDIPKQRGARSKKAGISSQEVFLHTNATRAEIEQILNMALSAQRAAEGGSNIPRDLSSLSSEELGGIIKDIFVKTYEDKDKFLKDVETYLRSKAVPSDEVISLMSNWRDSSIEEIVDALRKMYDAPKAVKKPAAAPSFARPKAPVTSPGLLSRVRAARKEDQPAQVPQSVPPTGTQPETTVDWHFLKQLPLSERANYLREKLSR